MGWSIGYDKRWKRWIGYGVVAYCDHPDCNEEIDRGLAYVCANEEPYGGEGCGLYFCENHLQYHEELGFACERCCSDDLPYFDPKPEHPAWILHLLTDESWQQWRDEEPEEHARYQAMWDALDVATKNSAIAQIEEEKISS